MINKVFEVRDRATCIPVLAIKMVAHNPIEHTFLWSKGYPLGLDCIPSVIMMRLDDQRGSSDPYWWKDRTHQVAHNYIYDNFDNIPNGGVVDVRVILGEEKEPAAPDIYKGS
jgi:hypothetical protein